MKNPSKNGGSTRHLQSPGYQKKKWSKTTGGAGSLDALVSSDLRQLHKLVKEIVTYAEEPSMWPLTPQEQISFVRTVIFQARKIRNTEQYVTTDLMLAAEAFTANVRISRGASNE